MPGALRRKSSNCPLPKPRNSPRKRPDVAVKFADAVKLGKHGGDRRSKASDQDRNTNLKRSETTDYIRARLERDGLTEMLARIDR